jgi:hypothetical protein
MFMLPCYPSKRENKNTEDEDIEGFTRAYNMFSEIRLECLLMDWGWMKANGRW